MIVLGVHDAIDSGASIVKDGKIMAAVGEERVIRSKLAYGFPREAINTVMKIAGVKPEDIDIVAVATKNNLLVNEIVPFKGWVETKNTFFRSVFLSTASTLSPLMKKLGFIEKLYYMARSPLYMHRRRNIRRMMSEEFGITCPVEFVDHHLAHASSTYYSSGFDDATVITLDGGGDGLSSSVYAVRNGKFQKLNQNGSLNSIGNFYSYVTYICGFTTHKHEGKITGLAAYGEPKYVEQLRSMIVLEDGKITNLSRLFGTSAIAHLLGLLPKDFSKADLAASIQVYLEEVTVKYVDHWMEKTGISNLALAGGVFANVKVNQRLHEIPGVDKMFIHPAMGDDGIAVGAAYVMSHADMISQGGGGKPLACIEDVYFGPEYSDDVLKKALENAELEYVVHEDVEVEIARLLSEGYVVARFDGRMEYGSRALGNRSILYQPTDRDVNDWLNKNLVRTEFMPFAPSTLAEHADDCFKNINGAFDPARFMTITFDCTDWMNRQCPGVVHIDGTARPQLVRKADNPSYYKIIEEFYKLTGYPCVINTSFNMHEEPIVCTPEDAIRAFQLGNLDYLAMGDYLIQNPNPLTHDLLPVIRNEHRMEMTSVPV